MARYEWILIEVLVLGLALWQLVSIRRAVRLDREKKAREERGSPSEPPAA